MAEASKLVSIKVRNLGCIGPEGLEVALDNIVCLVGRNNAGKSTILRAYELAQGSQPLSTHDRCQWAPEGDNSEVEIVVHIPDGVPNIDDKWKTQDGTHKLVKSRWQWREYGSKPIRQTWDKEANEGSGGGAEDGKAGGADNVFNARLPQPIRIGSLEDAFKEHDELLKLVTEPVASELKLMQADAESPLRVAIDAVVSNAMVPIQKYQQDIDAVAAQVGAGFKGVFPGLDVAIKVAMDKPTIDAAKQLLAGSSVSIREGAYETSIRQQGTGSRRALFWSLLQVRNMITRTRRAQEEIEKKVQKLHKDLEKERGRSKVKEDVIADLQSQLAMLTEGGQLDEVSLPGHILLIDEPENALHPMATRAARDYLYALARDPAWQVMLTTHSPYFVDPLEDHTTIVRLERSGNVTTPKTFRTSSAQFSEDDRKNLRAILQLDASLCEMFFGSYPIIVEGDTETASFIASVVERGVPLAEQVAIISAKGKALIPPMVKLLTHFRVPFGVLHDSDSPRRRDGKGNGAWSVNQNIIASIEEARAEGVEVRHRVSIPDFERRLGGIEEKKDKPIIAYRRLKEEPGIANDVAVLFQELFDSSHHELASAETMAAAAGDSFAALELMVRAWAADNAVGDGRFDFEQEPQAAS